MEEVSQEEGPLFNLVNSDNSFTNLINKYVHSHRNLDRLAVAYISHALRTLGLPLSQGDHYDNKQIEALPIDPSFSGLLRCFLESLAETGYLTRDHASPNWCVTHSPPV